MKGLLVVAITVAAISQVAGHYTGTCASIGYSERCCPPGGNCQASDGNCKCSADCHHFRDCCSDVSCPKEPRTCRDIGIQQCCNEGTAGEGGCIVYYQSGVTSNNEGCSCALSCHQSNNYECCPDAVEIGCVPETCTDAGKDPGCCTGSPQACSVTANGKTCFCDNTCIAFNDCCSDVPRMCTQRLMESSKLVSQLMQELQTSRAKQQRGYSDLIMKRIKN